MQGRSWMAALTFTANALLGLVLGFSPAIASRADDARSAPTPTPAQAPVPEDAPAASKVKLDLAIVGLGPKGCDIEIAPGHMGCQFRPVRLHLSHDDGGKAGILFDDVQATGADRYCIFAITIREPGQPVKTVRRGLRLVTPSAGRPAAQILTCYLSSPSKLAKALEMREHR
jgi:hypothetical protein